MIYRKLKNPDALERLLQALALQVGSEVSYNELASLVGIDKKTVNTYIQILEKAFIVFRLNPFSRNLWNELKKLRKISWILCVPKKRPMKSLKNLPKYTDSV